MSEIYQYLELRKDEMVELLGLLVTSESPSVDKEVIDGFSLLLEEVFEREGFRVTRLREEKYGDHLRAEYGTGAEQVTVLCHMDTVWPVGEVAKRPFRVDGNKAYGPGCYDMKAGIVQGLFGMRAIREVGARLGKRVVFLCNSDEEIGSPSSRRYIEEEARRSIAVIVNEPSAAPEGALKTSRKGVGLFTVTTRGRSAHAGADHARGINAIEEMAHQIVRLQGLTDYSVGTTVNVGLVTGGRRSNVVPDEARIEVDVRVPNRLEEGRILQKMRALKPVLKGATVEVSGGFNRPPMERSESIARLYYLAKAEAAELGFDLPEASTGGGSDGNFTASMGVPTLDGMGAVGDGSHSPDEYVVVSEMPKRAALWAHVLLKL